MPQPVPMGDKSEESFQSDMLIDHFQNQIDILNINKSHRSCDICSIFQCEVANMLSVLVIL